MGMIQDAGPDPDNALRRRMAATGIGYAGIDGAWWLPAIAPFVLPKATENALSAAGQACFALLDVVADYYGKDPDLTELMDFKRPGHIPGWHSRQPVLSLRPDFQLTGEGVVATELEICPSAHGYAHAMQVAYGCKQDIVPAVARLLGGRELLIVTTPEWREFMWEQLALCHALGELGARARLYCPESVARLQRRVRAGELWQPPIFGLSRKPDGWDDDITGRIARHGYADFIVGRTEWDEILANNASPVVFRFGYFENFESGLLEEMKMLERTGATFLNPTSFAYDSKSILAAVGLASVRKALGQANAGALAAVDACIPETVMLTDAVMQRLVRERRDWVVKFAGFDQGNSAWGGRSLQVGAQFTDDAWSEVLRQYNDLPFPVVAQRNAPTRRASVFYYDERGATQLLVDGATRLRAFFLRETRTSESRAVGVHITVSAKQTQVSEASDAVQAPVAFE